MTNNPTHNTGGNLEWFTQNLPNSYLNYPEQYLYNCALEVEGMEDIAEARRQFKACLVERKVSESMELEEIDQKDASEFMNPDDPELKVKRSEELVKLTQKHLDQKNEFTEASRLAFLELFHKEAPFRIVEMDEEYFTNRELVEVDLNTFLKKSNRKTIEDLNTNNPKASSSIFAQSGEYISWNTYLNQASRVFLQTKDGSHRQSYIVRKLIRIADPNLPEYVPMDEKYFNNSEYVKADMKKFFEKSTCERIEYLNTNNPNGSVEIMTQSGRTVKWYTYLMRASYAILGVKAKQKKLSKVLGKLFQIIEQPLSEYMPMDEKYFDNTDYVKTDLHAYLQKAKGDHLIALSSSNPPHNTSIVTQNGECVSWNTYLNRATNAIFKKGARCNQQLKTLEYMKGVCGVIFMNKEYFNNLEYVKADLDAFLKNAKGIQFSDLTTKNPLVSTYIITKNGENVSWQAYLKRASVALFGTKDRGDNPHSSSKALKKLIEIAEKG